jgi:uncharacterized protein
MSRLILIIIVIALVYLLLKSYRKKQSSQDEPAEMQSMVACAYCGVNLPKNEGLLVEGKYYCCAAHSRGQPDNRTGK